MTVYQGARVATPSILPRTTSRAGARPATGGARPATRAAGASRAVTGARPGTAALPRRRVRSAVRARRGTSHVSIALAVIGLGFVLAFFSLTQTVRVSSSGYDTDRMLVEQARLKAQVQDLSADLNRLAGEGAIRQGALEQGLTQLAQPLIVTPR
jgi:hypothetical protein